jgi:carboxyl-terminal processing protease
LRRGAVVGTLNGKPVGAVVDELSQYVHASNDRLARTHVFSYPVLFPDRVSLGLKSGDTVVIDRSMPADLSSPALNKSEGRWIHQDHVAYIRVPSFGDPVYESSAVDLAARYSSASTLIIDVRGNGGGATPQRLISSLMNRRFRTWRQIAPAQIPSRSEDPAANAYTGRVFMLIDRFCGSACEDFVMPFKDNHRATLIGEVTQGSSGNPYRTDLGLGIRVAIGAVRYAFPDGQAFEGVGIAPDIVVNRRVSDIASGLDAVLERAESLADSR